MSKEKEMTAEEYRDTCYIKNDYQKIMYGIQLNYYKELVAKEAVKGFVEDTINIIELINHKLMVVEDVVKGNEGDIITGVRGDLYSLIDALKQKGMEI